MFEKEYETFWKDQVRSASGQRLEMLRRDLTGTKKLLEEVLLLFWVRSMVWCLNMRF